MSEKYVCPQSSDPSHYAIRGSLNNRIIRTARLSRASPDSLVAVEATMVAWGCVVDMEAEVAAADLVRLVQEAVRSLSTTLVAIPSPCSLSNIC